MSAEPAVLIDQVCHRYGDREALRAVRIEVASGEIFGLLGENGGGKTTLFKILSTAFAHDSGNASVFGMDLKSKYKEARKRMGVVFQAPSLDKKLTVRENLR